MHDFEVMDGAPASEFEEAYGDQLEIRGAIFSETLGKVPRRPTLTVNVSDSIGAAIRTMNENHGGCALVLQGGKLAGIITERDILRKVAGTGLDLEHTPTGKIMTANPDTLPSSASIAYALQKMSVEGYRHIPLVDDQGRPEGVVAVRDIVSWMVSLFPGSILNLPPQPGFPKGLDGG
jgi:CBS domain-containing protein